MQQSTLNQRFLALLEQHLGDDPTASMMLTMFGGNLLSIPEQEFRAQMEKYLSMLQELLK